MALPKGKISKARKHSRRANWKVTVPGIVECPQCHQMKLAHRVCKHCGFYKGVQVLAVNEEKNAHWYPKCTRGGCAAVAGSSCSA